MPRCLPTCAYALPAALARAPPRIHTWTGFLLGSMAGYSAVLFCRGMPATCSLSISSSPLCGVYALRAMRQALCFMPAHMFTCLPACAHCSCRVPTLPSPSATHRACHTCSLPPPPAHKTPFTFATLPLHMPACHLPGSLHFLAHLPTTGTSGEGWFLGGTTRALLVHTAMLTTASLISSGMHADWQVRYYSFPKACRAAWPAMPACSVFPDMPCHLPLPGRPLLLLACHHLPFVPLCHFPSMPACMHYHFSTSYAAAKAPPTSSSSALLP